jgi:hypothetical protein
MDQKYGPIFVGKIPRFLVCNNSPISIKKHPVIFDDGLIMNFQAPRPINIMGHQVYIKIPRSTIIPNFSRKNKIPKAIKTSPKIIFPCKKIPSFSIKIHDFHHCFFVNICKLLIFCNQILLNFYTKI